MIETISYETIYTSVCCNRYSHCVDCKHSLIAFAAKHSVAVYDTQTYKVLKLLNGHRSQVNSVKWIQSNENLLISSSADKTAIVWDLNDLNDYKIKYQLIGHKESIITSDCCHLTDNELLSITSSTDKCLKIWLNDKQINELLFNNFVFDFKICKNSDIFDEMVLMTVGGNETIDVFQINQNSYQIKALIELKGHEDWIRSIDVFETKNNSLMIATASQDCFIRVHTIERTDKEESDIKQMMFSMETKGSKRQYLVNLETVLAGHEGWVSEVRWHQSSDNRLKLLSVSMDKTMVLWETPNEESDDFWIECLRVGEIGGNTLGFLGCASSPDLDYIIGYSFNGSLHIWKRFEEKWKPLVAISGHFGEVTDIAWEPNGEYLLSCSNDQTTRLHSIWLTGNEDNKTWHELARPQIHGYDIKCIAMIDRQTLTTGSDEKVIRVFKATKCFAKSLKMISNIDITSDNNDSDLAHSATVPTLGLSNCAVYQPEDVEHDFKPTTLEVPPTEETLLQNTLWPEIHKLYGHVFELFALAANNSQTIIASASKAAKAEHADIILWSVCDAKQITKLSAHQLTVTRIRFSKDDRFLLSASRDRTWSLFERQDNGFDYQRIGFSDKKSCIHSRIIWDCALTHDNQYFITVSRDKSAIFWRIDSKQSNPDSCLGPVIPCSSPLTLSQSITAVDICGTAFGDNYLVVFGLESGNICLYFWNCETFWRLLTEIKESHTLTVNRILFSPKIEYLTDGWVRVYVSTCSNDCSVKIFNILVKN